MKISGASWRPSGMDLAEYQLQSSHHVRFQDHVEKNPGLFAESAHCKDLLPCLHFPAGASFLTKNANKYFALCAFPHCFLITMPQHILPCVHLPGDFFFFREKMFSEKL